MGVPGLRRGKALRRFAEALLESLALSRTEALKSDRRSVAKAQASISRLPAVGVRKARIGINS